MKPAGPRSQVPGQQEEYEMIEIAMDAEHQSTEY
jgi:hypothetical protein